MHSEAKLTDYLRAVYLPLVPAHHLLSRSPPFAHFTTPAIAIYGKKIELIYIESSRWWFASGWCVPPLLVSLTSHHPRSRSLNLAWVKLSAVLSYCSASWSTSHLAKEPACRSNRSNASVLVAAPLLLEFPCCMAAGCSPETQESRMHINYFAETETRR